VLAAAQTAGQQGAQTQAVRRAMIIPKTSSTFSSQTDAEAEKLTDA
jgi:hypothetical protein